MSVNAKLNDRFPIFDFDFHRSIQQLRFIPSIPHAVTHPPEPPLDALLLVCAAPERHVHRGEDLEDLAGDERHRQDDQDVRDVLLLLRIRSVSVK